jgi:hypothetical protein
MHNYPVKRGLVSAPGNWPWSRTASIFFLLVCGFELHAGPNLAMLSVKDYGATGRRHDNARAAIQKAIDACAASGGGMVYLPPGEYTSGALRLRSHVRFFIEAGATVFTSNDPKDFDHNPLLYGEDIENISIEGRGTIDGQAEYHWGLSDYDDPLIHENSVLMQGQGRPLMRPFPKGYPDSALYPYIIQLIRCKDVRIAGISILHSQGWTIVPCHCERVVIDGIYIYNNPKEGVWADGIDPDGCKDVRIINSTIITGDDAIVFYSSNSHGAPLPCENITISNCRLSSASSALKFCDDNMNCIRNVTVDNCVITDSNRGVAFNVFEGGYVSNVVLSNLVIETHRFDWFWWGDGDPIHFEIRRNFEVNRKAPAPNEPPAGSIRNVLIRNVIAHGQGTCLITGHPDSWLDGISIENVKLFLSNDPTSPLQKAVYAMKIRWARNLKLKDIEVVWDKPESKKWESALYLEDVSGLNVEGFLGRQAELGANIPAVILKQVEDAVIRNSTALPGTSVFAKMAGERSRAICLIGNDFRQAKLAYEIDSTVRKAEIKALDNF